MRGRGAAFARLQLVVVHGQAHRAARLAPVEAGLAEDPIQPLLLGLVLHQTRPRHHHGADVGRHLAPLGDLGGGAQVLDAPVGARADEHAIDLDPVERRAGLERHVFERALHGAAAIGIGLVRRIGNAAGDRHHILGAGAPGDVGGDLRRRQRDLLVVTGAGIRDQLPPRRLGQLPGPRLGGKSASLQVLEGGLVRRHQPGPGAGLYRHVANRHAPRHVEPAQRRAGVLDDVAGAAGGADGADDGQDQVLGGDAQ